MGGLLYHMKGDMTSSSWKQNEARKLKFPRQKNLINIIPGRKKRNAIVDIIKCCCCPTQKWKTGNYNSRVRKFARKWYYDKLKAISDANKEYSDEHERGSLILQYDRDASVESEENDNEESLNLGRVFETSFLIRHSLMSGMSLKFNCHYSFTQKNYKYDL